jgi:hypothetical protein
MTAAESLMCERNNGCCVHLDWLAAATLVVHAAAATQIMRVVITTLLSRQSRVAFSQQCRIHFKLFTEHHQ